MKAIITGATKGIGKAIAVALVKEGYDLAVNARSETDLKSCSEELKALRSGAQIIFHQTDMSNKDEVLAFAAYVLERWNHVDVLINNAGIFIPGAIINEPDDVLEKMIQTNLYSAYHLTRKIVPSMMNKGSGHIFNMCSIASIIAYPNGGSYGISKFAMLGMSKAFREELKETGVKVTSILPGATWSNSWAGVELPEERLMQASDIAEVVLSALKMSPSAVVEDIVIRPQLGDL